MQAKRVLIELCRIEILCFTKSNTYEAVLIELCRIEMMREHDMKLLWTCFNRTL